LSPAVSNANNGNHLFNGGGGGSVSIPSLANEQYHHQIEYQNESQSQMAVDSGDNGEAFDPYAGVEVVGI